jgi:hypothetical protein
MAIEARIVEGIIVGFMIAVAAPFAAVVGAIQLVSYGVLVAEKRVGQYAIAAGVREIGVRTILFVKP